MFVQRSALTLDFVTELRELSSKTSLAFCLPNLQQSTNIQHKGFFKWMEDPDKNEPDLLLV